MMRRGIATLVCVLMLAVTPASFASAQTINVNALQQQIAALLAQVQLLQLQLQALRLTEGASQQSTLSAAPEGPSYNIYSLARRVQDEINAERRTRGLQTVSWNESLAMVARLHGEDQAEDNEIITNENKPCTYPLLRHEGTTRGLTVLERVRTVNSMFRALGENIVTFPLSINGSYSYQQSIGPVRCPSIEDFDPKDYDTPQERLDAFNEAREEREDALKNVRTVTWVSRDWRSEEEIAERAVQLWLDSPGHRENMLNSRYNEAGVGIARVNNYLIITQVFLQSR